jgi:hypothetical protein
MNAVLRRRLDEIRKRYVFTFVILSLMCKAFSGYLVYILPMTKGLFSVILDVWTGLTRVVRAWLWCLPMVWRRPMSLEKFWQGAYLPDYGTPFGDISSISAGISRHVPGPRPPTAWGTPTHAIYKVSAQNSKDNMFKQAPMPNVPPRMLTMKEHLGYSPQQPQTSSQDPKFWLQQAYAMDYHQAKFQDHQTTCKQVIDGAQSAQLHHVDYLWKLLLRYPCLDLWFSVTRKSLLMKLWQSGLHMTEMLQSKNEPVPSPSWILASRQRWPFTQHYKACNISKSTKLQWCSMVQGPQGWQCQLVELQHQPLPEPSPLHSECLPTCRGKEAPTWARSKVWVLYLRVWSKRATYHLFPHPSELPTLSASVQRQCGPLIQRSAKFPDNPNWFGLPTPCPTYWASLPVTSVLPRQHLGRNDPWFSHQWGCGTQSCSSDYTEHSKSSLLQLVWLNSDKLWESYGTLSGPLLE